MTLPITGHVHPEWESFGPLEWTIVAIASIVVVWTIYKAVQYTIAPGEDDPDHVKRIIFEEPTGPERRVSSEDAEDSSVE